VGGRFRGLELPSQPQLWQLFINKKVVGGGDGVVKIQSRSSGKTDRRGWGLGDC